MDQPITPFFQEDDATLLLSNTVTGSLWYVLNTAPNGLPDENNRVLVMQVTSGGPLSGQLNVQVFPLGVGEDAIEVTLPFDGAGEFGGEQNSALCGCTDELAANLMVKLNTTAGIASTMCSVVDPVVCNYEADGRSTMALGLPILCGVGVHRFRGRQLRSQRDRGRWVV